MTNKGRRLQKLQHRFNDLEHFFCPPANQCRYWVEDVTDHNPTQVAVGYKGKIIHKFRTRQRFLRWLRYQNCTMHPDLKARVNAVHWPGTETNQQDASGTP